MHPGKRSWGPGVRWYIIYIYIYIICISIHIQPSNVARLYMNVPGKVVFFVAGMTVGLQHLQQEFDSSYDAEFQPPRFMGSFTSFTISLSWCFSSSKRNHHFFQMVVYFQDFATRKSFC